MKVSFNLYSSEGCHLCELALAICQPLIANEQLNIIDIVDDESLVELYGVHIPVLERLAVQKKGTGAEKLFWPFNIKQVAELIK